MPLDPNYVSPSYFIIVAVFIISSNNYSHKRGGGVFAKKKYPMQELLLNGRGGVYAEGAYSRDSTVQMYMYVA